MLHSLTPMESTEIHTQAQIRGILPTALALCLVLACEDTTPAAVVPPEVDAGISACDQPLTRAHDIHVFRCPDGTRLGLRFANGVELNGVGPALELDGQLRPPSDWPEALWRAMGDTVEGQFPAAPPLPAMVYRARLLPDRVDLTIEIPPGDEVHFEGVDALYAKGSEMGLRVPGGAAAEWRAFPSQPGPFPVARDGVRRGLEQVIYSPSHAFHIGSATPGDGLVVELDNDAEAQRVGVRATLRTPVSVVAPTSFSLTIELRAGTGPTPILDDYGASRVGPERRQAAGWGWRSGPRYGDRADLVLLTSQALALANRPGPNPHLIIDGRWYSALGNWQASDDFSSGFPGLVELISPARLGIRWPVLHVEPESGVAEAHPDWIVEGTCARSPCTMINPSLPAVQDTLRGEANKLYDKGVSVIAISGTSALDSPRAHHAVAEALPTYALAGLEAQPGAALRAGRTTFAPVSTLSGDCLVPSSAESCPGAMTDPKTLTTQAFALATRWHHDHIAPLDPGAIRVDGLPRGQARQWATLGAVSGGWYLLGDDATGIEPGAMDIFFAPLKAKAVIAAQPVYADGDMPPSEWMSETTLAIFNWTDAPLTWMAHEAATRQFDTMKSVFDAESTLTMDAGLVLEVPPRDALFFVATE